VGADYDIIREIKQMYADEGKPPPKAMKISVYYNRGVMWAAVHARAIQLAVKKHGPNITSRQVKEGMESIRDFDLGGFLPALNITPEDHEGGGYVQVWQVKGGKWVPASKWFRGYRKLVFERVQKAG